MNTSLKKIKYILVLKYTAIIKFVTYNSSLVNKRNHV